jgi:hypothetical protein
MVQILSILCAFIKVSDRNKTFGLYPRARFRRLGIALGPLKPQQFQLRTIIGPEIAFVVQQLSQFLSKPIILHYDAACIVVRYLKGSPGKGLLFPRSPTLHILGFADADWENRVDTRRSTSGYCFFLGNSLSHGDPRSRVQSLEVPLKLSIELYLLLLVSCNGYFIF